MFLRLESSADLSVDYYDHLSLEIVNSASLEFACFISMAGCRPGLVTSMVKAELA